VSLTALLAPALSFPLCATALPYTDRTIQIAIAHQVSDLTIEPEGDFILRDKERARSLKAGKKYSLKGSSRGLFLGDFPLSGPGRIDPAEPGSAIQVGSKRYRAKLLARPDEDGTVTVVAEMAMENYLLGVLPYEMEPNWPLEALKAQAVVARTFAYYNLGKYKKQGFDLTADTRTQVYGGLGRDSLLVRQAVDQTRGEVLGYAGELLSVYYHACCGGQTGDAGRVWGAGKDAPKPLRGVRDKYCVKSPHYRWTAYFTHAALLAAGAGGRLLGGKVRSVRITGRDGAGDATTFSIKTSAENLTVKAADLRKRLGNEELKSARVTQVKDRKAGVEFFGRGSGHGVGLCQWGSRLQALEGRGYEKILKFYFPGAVLSLVDE
jgi:stage II sporulation protein D